MSEWKKYTSHHNIPSKKYAVALIRCNGGTKIDIVSKWEWAGNKIADSYGRNVAKDIEWYVLIDDLTWNKDHSLVGRWSITLLRSPGYLYLARKNAWNNDLSTSSNKSIRVHPDYECAILPKPPMKGFVLNFDNVIETEKFHWEN